MATALEFLDAYMQKNPPKVKQRQSRYFIEAAEGSNVICFVCTGPHSSSACPRKRCYRCGEIGHEAVACNDQRLCRFCRHFGHDTYAECPVQQYNRGLDPKLQGRNVLCPCCGSTSHLICGSVVSHAARTEEGPEPNANETMVSRVIDLDLLDVSKAQYMRQKTQGPRESYHSSTDKRRWSGDDDRRDRRDYSARHEPSRPSYRNDDRDRRNRGPQFDHGSHGDHGAPRYEPSSRYESSSRRDNRSDSHGGHHEFKRRRDDVDRSDRGVQLRTRDEAARYDSDRRHLSFDRPVKRQR